MKADEVKNMENNNDEMEYITLPTIGIFTDMQCNQSNHYAASNEYLSQENCYNQNYVNNSNGQFFCCGYSAFPNCCSCCCGYHSKDNNNIQQSGVATTQNTQNYGQVEYQYNYADQSNTGQYNNVNRCAGGMERYPINGTSSKMSYQESYENNEINNFASNIKQEAQSNYFTMPSLGNMEMNINDYANNAFQDQTVYRSDFQPFNEKGNNFNHFPNNNFMDMRMFKDLIQESPCQSVSSGCSYQIGDPAYDMDENQDQMPNSNQVQMCDS